MRLRGCALDDVYLGQAVNPTQDLAIAKADGDLQGQDMGYAPPPDEIWLPQLYADLKSIRAVAREAGLPVRKVRRFLAERGLLPESTTPAA